MATGCSEPFGAVPRYSSFSVTQSFQIPSESGRTGPCLMVRLILSWLHGGCQEASVPFFRGVASCVGLLGRRGVCVPGSCGHRRKKVSHRAAQRHDDSHLVARPTADSGHPATLTRWRACPSASASPPGRPPRGPRRSATPARGWGQPQPRPGRHRSPSWWSPRTGAWWCWSRQ